MSVFVDPLFLAPRRNRFGRQWCHMMSDESLAELHSFARAIGVARCWFHGDHYDLNPEQRETAIAHGAQPTSARNMVAVRQALRGEP